MSFNSTAYRYPGVTTPQGVQAGAAGAYTMAAPAGVRYPSGASVPTVGVQAGQPTRYIAARPQQVHTVMAAPWQSASGAGAAAGAQIVYTTSVAPVGTVAPPYTQYYMPTAQQAVASRAVAAPAQFNFSAQPLLQQSSTVSPPAAPSLVDPATMTGIIEVGGVEKEIRVVEVNGRYYVYKDQFAGVTPGTELVWSGSGKKLVVCGAPMEFIAMESADDLGKRIIDLQSPTFQWYQKLKQGVAPAEGRPWVIVAMGTPAIGKSTFMKNATSEQQDAINSAVGVKEKVPFGNVFYKQLDDIVAAGAQSEFNTLYDTANGILDPHERFRVYWANKQSLFTRYAVDKPSGEGSPPSYESRVGAAMIQDLTFPEQPYNIGMETTGLSPGLVKFGLSSPCYDNYNKLVLFFDFADEDGMKKAALMAHSRLIQELNTKMNMGGEQHSQYLDVIATKARETYKVCQELAASKNAELDANGSEGGRWFCHRVEQKLNPEDHHWARIEQFYAGSNYDAQGPAATGA